MHCPKCSFLDTRVYDSRITHQGNCVKRRRECPSCSYRFTTLEEIKVLDLKVQKRNDQIVDLDFEKLKFGIKKAFNKRKIDNQQLNTLVQEVIEDILATDKNPIKTTRIGKIVLKNLKNIDEAAYICFGAMFWNFDSFGDFQKLIKDFQKD
jgi:transcriptional repressor NrdR